MIAFGCREVEFYGFREIHLGDDGQIGGVENRRVFERLFFALGDRKRSTSRRVFARYRTKRDKPDCLRFR